MTTAEKYRQIEKSSVISSLRLILKLIKPDCETIPLGNIIQNIKTGKTPSKQEKRFYEDAFISWFKPDEIGSTKFLNDSKDYLSKFAYDTKQVTIYEPGSILINAIGDIGRVSILLKEASSNQQITGIRLKETVNNEYAYYYLVANRHYFYVDLFQTTLPIVNQKKISIIPFILPPFEIQMRIVAGLQKLEKIKSIKDIEIIEKIDWEDNWKIQAKKIFLSKFNCNEITSELTYQLSLVKQLRQAFLREAMQGKLVPQLPEDGHAKDLLAQIKAEKAKLGKKEKPLPPISPEEIPFEIPEGWVWCRGELVANFIDPQPSHRTPPVSSDGVPYIAMSDISMDGSIDFNSARKVGNSILQEHRDRYLLEKGDFIFGKIGTLGKPVLLPQPFNYTLSANVILIQANRRVVYDKYLFHFLSSTIAEKELKDKKSTTSYPVFGMGKARNMIIPLPPLSEQYRIVKKLEELMMLCDSIMQNILIGRIETEQLLQQVQREALA